MYNKYWGQDRRRFQRLKINISVWYSLDSHYQLFSMESGRDYEATTIDLSEAGVALAVKHDIPVSAALIIKFRLFKTERQGIVRFFAPLEVAGQVRSNTLLENSEHRLGVYFKEIEKETKEEISDFISLARRP